MKLTKDTFNMLAIKHYDMRKAVSMAEFEDDMKRFHYIKRLFRRFQHNDDLKIRLILNHITILYNCLGPIATPMLFMKLEEYHSYLKPFVIFLNFMPDRIEYADQIILSSEIPLDTIIVKELRKL